MGQGRAFARSGLGEELVAPHGGSRMAADSPAIANVEEGEDI